MSTAGTPELLDTVVAATAAQPERMLHVMVNGQSHDATLSVLDVGDASTDDQIRQRAADHFHVPVEKLRFHDVVRNPENGNITLHPRAQWG